MDLSRELRNIGLTNDQCIEVIDLINKYSRLMCNKQKEICLREGKITSDEPYEWQQIVDEVGKCPFYIDEDSILLSSYPEELQ